MGLATRILLVLCGWRAVWRPDGSVDWEKPGWRLRVYEVRKRKSGDCEVIQFRRGGEQ